MIVSSLLFVVSPRALRLDDDTAARATATYLHEFGFAVVTEMRQRAKTGSGADRVVVFD